MLLNICAGAHSDSPLPLLLLLHILLYIRVMMVHILLHIRVMVLVGVVYKTFSQGKSTYREYI